MRNTAEKKHEYRIVAHFTGSVRNCVCGGGGTFKANSNGEIQLPAAKTASVFRDRTLLRCLLAPGLA